MGVLAWKSQPWYVVVARDRAIPPDARRLFASRNGRVYDRIPSHVAMVARAAEVTPLITAAAETSAVTP